MDTAEYLMALGEFPERIRNFCMVAHVDHGKTTLSDFLLASNGVLSEQLAGKVRFLDSREDEQERWITMKASSIALRHKFKTPNTDKAETYLLHLVDSPGHIDFNSEVSTAIRVADSAVIVVDLVDCVTTQTMSMLRQVFNEGLSMVLVLNKIDLLITKMQLSAEEAYLRCRQVIETCNMTLASYVNTLSITGERMELLVDVPEDFVWFSSVRGNVVVTSCLDGWGFKLNNFARIYTKKLGITITPEHLWGNHYYDNKNKCVLTKPKNDNHQCMAVQMIFQPLWNLHEAFLSEPMQIEKAIKMSETIEINENVWNKPSKNARAKLVLLLKNWMPLAQSVLDMICEHAASPIASQQRRLPRLIPQFDALPDDLKGPMMRCDASKDVPMVAFVSKLLDTDSLAGIIGFDKGDFDIESCFVGFARIYSGKVLPGQSIRLQSVCGVDLHCNIDKVFLLRGRGLEEVSSMSAGCLCGISGIAKHVIKYATISTDDRLPAMVLPRLSSTSIVRQSLIPRNPADLPQLYRGLELLNKVDPQVEIIVLPTGEHVIGAAGEVHAERCVKDLKDTFARIEMYVSEPLVTFRETIVKGSIRSWKHKPVTVNTPQNHFSITLHARPLPDAVFEEMRDENKNVASGKFADKLIALISESEEKKKWGDVGRLWAWGPQKLGYCGALLFDSTLSNEAVPSVVISKGEAIGPVVVDETFADRMHKLYRDAIVSGFQLACTKGPMADEPLIGVAFVVTNVMFAEGAPELGASSLAGQIITCVNQACRRAMEQHSRRLVEPVYDCIVYSAGTTQGKIYSLLSKRRATILDEVPNEGSDLFYISCLLPTAASFGLQDDLRVNTSGAATAQLRMTQWAVVDEDPYYRPTTREEIEEDGTDVPQNFAGQMLEGIRRRKGLHREIIVENAEKQVFSRKS